MSPTRLFIVRHGNTFDKGDVITRVGGRTDPPLSSSGRDQVDRLARHFAGADLRFASGTSGPLKRTRETAAAILAAQPEAPELETRLFLREIDYGPDENLPEEAVLARIGAAALEAWETHGVPPPGWRVDPQALIGNWQTLLAEMADAPGDHLVVTSNGVARFALAAAGETVGARAAKLPTAGWGVLAAGDAGWTVQAWGERAR